MNPYKDMSKSIFQMRNFFDEISIIDKDGYIQYCEIFIPGVYGFTADEIIGRHIFDIFSSSSPENSEIYKVLTTGRPITFFEENCVTYKGDKVKGYSSIYPLYRGRNLIGAAVALKFLPSGYKEERIEVMNYNSMRRGNQFHYTLDHLITADPYMLSVKDIIKKIAPSDSSILIQGATGTGKEIVAQSIHYESHRQAQPFISQNCSAIPANLIESTFFGTEKGSYTGAVSSKGLFELANKGTLFLDEINSMDFAVQGKILKAIEDRKIRRIGGHDLIPIDVRIVAAVNEDPFAAIEDKRLRSDLFYRLNVNSITLTPLRERAGDIDYVTDYYLQYYSTAKDTAPLRITAEVRNLFNSYSWPGNLRELRNVIEGASNLCEKGEITLADIPRYMTTPAKKTDPAEYDCRLSYQENLDRMERAMLKANLKRFSSKKEAAEFLGMSKQTLNYKLNKLQLKYED